MLWFLLLIVALASLKVGLTINKLVLIAKKVTFGLSKFIL